VRQAFAKTLVELADRDDRVVLLTGDLGFTVLEPFSDRFPDRFFNVGVAEQNMLGLATGLAESGFIPFVYSIATFASMRAYEFIRNGAIVHDLPVRVVGVGGGFDYGHNGMTHFALEDVALMRAQPGMTVVVPCDAEQTRTALRATWDLPRPIYLRLGKASAPVPELGGRFELARLDVLAEGGEVAIVGLGPAVHEAWAAGEKLRDEGLDCTVAAASSLNPSPVDDLAGLLSRAKLVLSVEGAYVNGGLGSLIAEVIAEHRLACRLVRCGVQTTPRGDAGATPYLQDRHGISASAIASKAIEALDLVGS
jgi:transketolase